MLERQEREEISQEARAANRLPTPPALSLPKGGGAIRGIGEKFSTNLATGTAALTCPIPTSPGRGGFGPQLELVYGSGVGNGPFGLGWNLPLASVSRRTDKGIPLYRDEEESDTFLLSDEEDLVPVLVPAGAGRWERDTLESGPFRVERYRPRVDKSYLRIERWTRRETGEVQWKCTSRDNVTSLYGTTPASRLADPRDSRRVFRWLLDERRDDRGHVVVFEYKRENKEGVDPLDLFERNRLSNGDPYGNLYLKRIRYGNRTPFETSGWLFEVVFDYGEHDAEAPEAEEEAPWLARRDAFSSYRAGFEIRTHRLCRRVLLFHHFPELGERPCLVRSTDFAYAEGPAATLLTSVTQTGYLREPDGSAYRKKSLPPLEFEYNEHRVGEEIRAVDPESVENLPAGLDNSGYRWVDLDGEGISGVLTEQGNAWYYKRNLGGGRLGGLELVARRPSLADLAGSGQRLADLTGDGSLSLVLQGESLSGFFARGPGEEWAPFAPFRAPLNRPVADPNVRLVDLDGDGLTDVLISEDEVFRWYPSLGEEGFGPPMAVPKPDDEERGPKLVFADSTQSIYLADMSGDGLTDLVRIRNGDVCYWPNLGHGRFGARVAMEAAPLFDHPDRFRQNHILLADIDGSGTSDLIYLGCGEVTYWINQAGNRFGEGVRLRNFPATDDLSAVTAVDLLGSGTACLAFSTPLPEGRNAIRYVDLADGIKPYLLKSVRNNLGAQTRLDYAPSTKFYLEDRAAGSPWVTRLPFPVHVVERVEARDEVTGSRLVTRYRYRHGYYDRREREFRGFGLVEQWDAESLSEGGEDPLFVPPAQTRTWFHTGAYLEGERISELFAAESYRGDPEEPALADAPLPPGLDPDEERQACRALKGQMLRQEVYALDGSPRAGHPYRVAQSRARVRRMQPRQGSRHAVFCVLPGETIESHYERNPADPRVGHRVTLEVDEFGNVIRSAAIGYPRRVPAHSEQGLLAVTCTEASVVNESGRADWYRLGIPMETRTWELTGIPFAGPAPLAAAAVEEAARLAAEIPFEEEPAAGVLQKRLIGRMRCVYYANDLSAPLAFGAVESLALPYETRQMAFTPGLVARVFGDRVTEGLLETEGRYRFDQGAWWIRSGHPVYDPARFYLPVRFLDPFGEAISLEYDPYALLVEETRDSLDNVVRAVHDYQVLAPVQVTDANGNRSAAALDELGMVVATALLGKEGAGEGDSLEDPTTRLEYDLFNWANRGRPNFVHTSARERHGAASRWQESYVYSDGFGREVLRKIQAEPGPAPARGPDGELLRDGAGALVFADTFPDGRWIGSGRTVFDNKGNPVKKYEPFFSATHEYEDDEDLVQTGVTTILHYDPVGRLVRTDCPDGTFSTVTFDAWTETTWDRNDTVLESRWYADRQALPVDPGTAAERRAADLAARHAGTPAVAHLDILGRPFLAVADAGPLGTYETRLEMDIQGNVRGVIDARGNRAVRQSYDMISRKLSVSSADAGETWTLADVAGNPLRAWNGRGFEIRHSYDALRRSTHLRVRENGGPEILAVRTVYGESHPEAVERNLRGRVYELYDGAGSVRNVRYDFKGNLLAGRRTLALDPAAQADWNLLADLADVAGIAAAAAPLLEAEFFSYRTSYDALNRPISLTAPDESEIRPGYNEAGLLERLDVRLRGAGPWTPFVDDVDYNARGQREQIAYGNGLRTRYTWDPLTFRLTRLETTRADGTALADLLYTFDPAGNILEIEDSAPQTVFFDNAVVSAGSAYEYDALYRLVRAGGREHAGQNADEQRDSSDVPIRNLPEANDAQAMRNYTERYEYDGAGNILRMVHEAAGGGWTRHYEYEADSNRLRATSLPGDAEEGPYSARYEFDAAGNMTRMPHLSRIEWTFQDQMSEADLGGGGTATFRYGADGARVRKLIERNASLVEERISLGGYEIFRRRNGAGVVFERRTLHVMDDRRRIALVEMKTVEEGIPVSPPESLIRYQLADHRDSVSMEADDSGRVISHEEYHPFGTSSFRSMRGGVEVSPRIYRYNGAERDDETALYQMGARYYAPWLARWTSCDPAGGADGPNLYQYARDNPIGFTDPTGRQSLMCGGEEEVNSCEMPEVEICEEAYESEAPPPRPPPAARPAPGPAPLPEIDESLEVGPGIVSTTRAAMFEEAAWEGHPWYVRAGTWTLGFLMTPLYWGEEYIGRPVADIPYRTVAAGQLFARATLRETPMESAEDVLGGVTHLTHAGLAAWGVVAPMVAPLTEGAVAVSSAAAPAAEAVPAAAAVETATLEHVVRGASGGSGIGILYVRDAAALSPAELETTVAAMRDMDFQAGIAGGLTRRAAADLRPLANRAAALARSELELGATEAAGHMPDVAGGGHALGAIMGMPRWVNASWGGQWRRYGLGFVFDGFSLVDRATGMFLYESLGLEHAPLPIKW